MATLETRVITWTAPKGLKEPVGGALDGSTESIVTAGLKVFEDSDFIVLALMAQDEDGAPYRGGVWIPKGAITGNVLASAYSWFASEGKPTLLEWNGPPDWDGAPLVPGTDTPAVVPLAAFGDVADDSVDVVAIVPRRVGDPQAAPVVVPQASVVSRTEVGGAPLEN